jgi:hypothetical protein
MFLSKFVIFGINCFTIYICHIKSISVNRAKNYPVLMSFLKEWLSVDVIMHNNLYETYIFVIGLCDIASHFHLHEEGAHDVWGKV